MDMTLASCREFVTVLAVKDRVTGHNPIQAIYMANGYYKKRFYGDK